MSFYGYNPQMNLDRINKQIEDLNNLKMQMQQPQQAPINNYINTGTAKVDLEAKIVTDGQDIKDIIVQNRTVFIDEKNKKISIKELDGTISKEYEIIIPLTAEQKEIKELKDTNNLLMERIKQMEVLINDEYGKSNKSNRKNKQSDECNVRDDESTAKTNNEQSKRNE